MTCEVAVLKKRGVALTADSAVTLTDGDGQRRKLYYTAEKLSRPRLSSPWRS